MNHGNWTDEMLLSEYAEYLQAVVDLQAASGHIQQELIRRMSERQATSIPSEKFICELTVKDTYDQVSFGPLKEILNEADLATCYTPAHEETVQVADRWQTVRIKALARRYGAEAQEVVDRARIPGAPSLSFKTRQPAHSSAFGGLMEDPEVEIRHVGP